MGAVVTGTRATLTWVFSLAIAGCITTEAPASVRQQAGTTYGATSTATASSTPLPSTMATPAFVGAGPLPAGLYGVDIGGVNVTFTIPDGWVGPPSTGFAVVKEGPTEQAGMILSFWWPANVYADVCDNTSLLDPPIGPTVGDFARALANQSGTEATDPTPTTVDGYRGQRLVFVVRTDVADCPSDMWLWLDKDGGRRSTDSDEDSELSILDVGGERVVIYVLHSPGTPEEELAELRTIFDSIQIEP
jgi:hypothetical protein